MTESKPHYHRSTMLTRFFRKPLQYQRITSPSECIELKSKRDRYNRDHMVA